MVSEIFEEFYFIYPSVPPICDVCLSFFQIDMKIPLLPESRPQYWNLDFYLFWCFWWGKLKVSNLVFVLVQKYVSLVWYL